MTPDFRVEVGIEALTEDYYLSPRNQSAAKLHCIEICDPTDVKTMRMNGGTQSSREEIHLVRMELRHLTHISGIRSSAEAA
jgi:hypothetical protein